MKIIYFKVFFALCLVNIAQTNETLKQIHILFRHGERSPSSSYPNDPYKDYKWPGLGYLTNKGKYQMYNLGIYLRSLYNNLLGPYYWPSIVNFTSSYADRCLMSAQLVASGLFPPKDYQIWNPDLLWQPIPIHYLPRTQDNLIAMKTKCPKYDKEFVDVHNSTKVQNYNTEYTNIYQYLTENTGMTVKDIETVESLYNTLEIQQLNNLTLPQWVNSSIMSQMKIIGAQNLAIYSETEYMKRMKGGFFIKTVTDLMQKALNGSNTPSINLYSGHDLTLVHVMRALNLIDTIKPEFGASLVIELHNNSEIKILYINKWNGNSEEQTLEECNSPCTLEKFIKAFKAVIPLNWEKECQLNISETLLNV
ncbi:lysosomal acid phosphatase-like [Rhynchophorus ferrugineus]|uniref:lysosomal acid phosphatase-like n=1 Tax=Rhynchophorus ferrugineus TaxID=354439 RepID=UPI003FCEE41A